MIKLSRWQVFCLKKSRLVICKHCEKELDNESEYAWKFPLRCPHCGAFMLGYKHL